MSLFYFRISEAVRHRHQKRKNLCDRYDTPQGVRCKIKAHSGTNGFEPELLQPQLLKLSLSVERKVHIFKVDRSTRHSPSAFDQNERGLSSEPLRFLWDSSGPMFDLRTRRQTTPSGFTALNCDLPISSSLHHDHLEVIPSSGPDFGSPQSPLR